VIPDPADSRDRYTPLTCGLQGRSNSLFAVELRRSYDRRTDSVFRVVAIAASLGLIVFIVAVVISRTPRPSPATFPSSPPPALTAGSVAPVFSLQRLGGGPTVDLAGLRGSPVVVNFFASWCPDCKAELAGFARFARSEAGRIDVVGVDTNDSNAADAIRLLRQAGAAYPVGVDPLAKVATRYLVQALPVTYFIGADGRVVGVAFGQLTSAILDSWMARLSPRSGT
jgi:cytochrome c biogenesis protein CcmG, thiol:disulfide interchange protein DsbE